jgi:hypothetical protein
MRRQRSDEMTVHETVLPTSATPGAEMAALAPFYRDWRWTGLIEAGGMGPGSPAMTGVGSARSQLVQGGLWYACDFEQDQRLLDGTHVLTWQLHWVTGWDGRAGEYRASSADNQGPNLGLYRGRIVDGDQLVYASADETLPRIRLTWKLDDPGHCRWRNEITFDGATWSLIEEYAMVAAA